MSKRLLDNFFTAPNLTDIEPKEPQPQIIVYPEVKYSGRCFDEPCFYLPDGYQYGKCTKIDFYITLSLAKQQKLCANKDTIYYKLVHQIGKKPKKEKTKP
jgi:hypothetical protein